MKEAFTFEVLAIQIGRHFDNEPGATKLLQDAGLLEEPDKTPGSENAFRYLDYIENKSLSESAERHLLKESSPVFNNKQDFSWDFFTLIENSQTDHEKQKKLLEGPVFDPQKLPARGVPPPRKAPEELPALLRRLNEHLQLEKFTGIFFTRKMVDISAKGEPLTRIPFLFRQGDSNNLLILLDKRGAMNKLLPDCFELFCKLKRNWPICHIRFAFLPNGPFQKWGFMDQELVDGPAPMPLPYESCLILTDLACEAGRDWHQWLKFRNLNHNRVVWMSPNVPNETTTHSHIRADNTIIWGGAAKGIKNSAGLELILSFVSCCRVVPSGMIRELALHFKLPLGQELRFYRLGGVRFIKGANWVTVNIKDKSKREQLNDILETMSVEQLNTFNAISEPWLLSVSPEILHEHRILLHLARPTWRPAKLRESIDFFRSLGASLKANNSHADDIADYLKSTMSRVPANWKQADATVQRVLLETAVRLKQSNVRFDVPGGMNLSLEQELNRGLADEEVYRMSQLGGKLYFAEDEQEVLGTLIESFKKLQGTTVEISEYFQVDSSNPFYSGKFTSDVLQLCKRAESKNLQVCFSPLQNSQFIHFKSSMQSIWLKKLSVSDLWWATSLAITSEGVVAEAEHIKVIWPKEPEQAFEFAKWDVRTGGQNRGSEGGLMCFTHETPRWFHSHRPELDATGLVNTLDVNGVQFNLRYIPPGSFLMGSPEDEPERFDREILHPVTLTQGFWIGETTVTQQLWQAVMGDNPSEFTPEGDEQLPVETVSWYDCQTFCKKLSELTGAEFALPTEAQWEYACRAGSTTPFNTGEQLGFEQGNYDVNHPYHGKQPLQLQPGQEYRGKTVDVHKFVANRWGLKQMHGNVFEWCQDDWREDIAGHEVDPFATGDKAAGAVLRGGGWGGNGRGCRSAFRSHDGRGGRYFLVGLRVTQVIDKAEPDE